MAKAYGIEEKVVATWWRGVVRQAWGGSPFKRAYEASTVQMVKNTNVRSMKRFPLVKRFTCVGCGVDYGASGVQLDHIEGRNQMKSLADAESFMKAILFSPPDNLNWLCADKSKMVNKKKYVYECGCHSTKSLIDINPEMSLPEAKAKKELARLKKYKEVEVALGGRGVVSSPSGSQKQLPKFKKDQEALLLELLIKEYK